MNGKTCSCRDVASPVLLTSKQVHLMPESKENGLTRLASRWPRKVERCLTLVFKMAAGVKRSISARRHKAIQTLHVVGKVAAVPQGAASLARPQPLLCPDVLHCQSKRSAEKPSLVLANGDTTVASMSIHTACTSNADSALSDCKLMQWQGRLTERHASCAVHAAI